MKILLTGSRGFIGSYIFTFLKNYKKFSIDIFNKGDTLQSKNYDVIIHCAAITPLKAHSVDDYITNVHLTNEIVNLYKDSFIIYFSTKDIYGKPCVDSITEESVIYDPSIYGISKLYGEKIIIQKAKRFVILRLPAVVGSNAPETFMVKIIKQIINNETVSLYNPHKKFNSILHIKDLLSVIHYILDNLTKLHNDIYNVSAREPILIKEISIIISDLLNIQKCKIKNIKNDECSSLFVSEKIQNQFNLKFMSVEEVIKSLVTTMKGKYE